MIHLIGPGGAGKSTVGAKLAERLGARFVDLDAEFAARSGSISAYLDACGYDAYAHRNVSTYSTLVSAFQPATIVALSSGVMTYRLAPPLAHTALDQHSACGQRPRGAMLSRRDMLSINDFRSEAG